MMKSITDSFTFKKLRTLDIVVLGLLLAAGLVLNQLKFGTQFIQFGFGFVVTALISTWYGPWWSVAIAAISDIVGTILTGGVYFPGFTVSAILGAFIYGVFFYRRNISWPTVITAQLIIAVVVNTLLNTLWLTLMYKTPFWALVSTRLVKEVIITPIQIIILYFVLNSRFIKTLYNRLNTK
ncbi:folate family ECF transporter S component [Lentilactobacillus senioris]|uniref:folate family ECF transporter S component n=1 Tax=Lentilactobacillus senioris TaxID=931534 RepID=UPI003D2A36D3